MTGRAPLPPDVRGACEPPTRRSAAAGARRPVRRGEAAKTFRRAEGRPPPCGSINGGYRHIARFNAEWKHQASRDRDAP